MSNSIDGLLPCPFCGGPPINVAGEYIACGAGWNGQCPGHGVKAAPKLWNTRPPTPSLREDVVYPIGAAAIVVGEYEGEWRGRTVFIHGVEWSPDGPLYTICEKWPPEWSGLRSEGLTDGFSHGELSLHRVVEQGK